MASVGVPVKRLDTDTARRQLGPEGIERVLVEMVQRHLYLDLEPEQLLAVDDPEEGPRRKLRRAVTEYDRIPVYELRYSKEMKWSQAGLMTGTQQERLFAVTVENGFQRILDGFRKEQPNADWRLVAGTVEQVNMRRTVPVGQRTALQGAPIVGTAALEQALAQADDPPAIPVGRTTSFHEEPDIRWYVLMAFADIAKSELVDPNLGHGDGKAGPMSEYIATRQFKNMPAGLRNNRNLAAQLIADFYARQGLVVDDEPPVALPRFTPDQVATMRAMRGDGIPLAMIARVVGASVREVEDAIGGPPDA